MSTLALPPLIVSTALTLLIVLSLTLGFEKATMPLALTCALGVLAILLAWVRDFYRAITVRLKRRPNEHQVKLECIVYFLVLSAGVGKATLYSHPNASLAGGMESFEIAAAVGVLALLWQAASAFAQLHKNDALSFKMGVVLLLLGLPIGVWILRDRVV